MDHLGNCSRSISKSETFFRPGTSFMLLNAYPSTITDFMGWPMLEIDRRKWIFRTKEIWFCDDPRYNYDVQLTAYDSVIFNACKSKVNLPNFKREEQFTVIIDLTKGLDSIRKEMSKRCRYGISRAIRDGVAVKMNQDYDRFYSMNKSFNQMKEIPPTFLSRSDLEALKAYGTLFVSQFNEEILAGMFCIEDESNIRWLVGASKRLQVSRDMAALIGNANRLTIWEIIKYAKAKGIRQFDLGGYYMGQHGTDEELERINFFKKSVGGEIAPRYHYRSDSTIYRWARTCYDKLSAAQIIRAIAIFAELLFFATVKALS